MSEVANQDSVEESNTKRNLCKGSSKCSSLRTDPLEEDDETNNVASDTSSSNEHVADTEHEIVDREGCNDLTTEKNKLSEVSSMYLVCNSHDHQNSSSSDCGNPPDYIREPSKHQ